MTAFSDETGREQAFERFPKLAGWIERLAGTQMDLSLKEWGEFLAELNVALSAAPVGEPLRRIVLDTLNAVAPAVENLSVHQEQCDRDGVMVKVSRQALDEVLNAVNEVAMQSAITTSPASPVAQEPVARLCGYCKTWNSKPCGEQCYLQPSDPVWTAPVAQEPVAWRSRSIFNDVVFTFFAVQPPEHEQYITEPLYTFPPATPAGLGADEIARVFARWKKSKNLHESLAAQSIEKELLALLSRAGDQK